MTNRNEDGLLTFQVLAYKSTSRREACGHLGCYQWSTWFYPPIFIPNPMRGWSVYDHSEFNIMPYIKRYPATCDKHRLTKHPARIDYA